MVNFPFLGGDVPCYIFRSLFVLREYVLMLMKHFLTAKLLKQAYRYRYTHFFWSYFLANIINQQWSTFHEIIYFGRMFLNKGVILAFSVVSIYPSLYKEFWEFFK